MKNSRTLLRCMLLSGLLGTIACGDTPEASLATTGESARASSDDALTEGGQCNLEGTWAIKFVIPVTWKFNLGIQGGKGEIVQWARSVRRHEDSHTVVDSLVPCGSTVPDYKAQPVPYHSESYGTRFPDSLFDNGTLPATEVRTHVGSFAVGGQFQSGFAPIQLGVRMGDPLNDAWPAKVTDLDVFDADNDGYPGVTLVADKNDGYSNPPTSPINGKRATKFFVAIRNVASTSGVIDHCDRLSAQAEIPKIGGKVAINSHVVGCMLEDGSLCTAAQADMLDRYQPRYEVHDATAAMVRVTDATTCKEIRDMSF